MRTRQIREPTGRSAKLTVVYERNDEGDRSSVRESRSGVSPLLIAFIVLAILAVVFILQNGERADDQLPVLRRRRRRVGRPSPSPSGSAIVLDRLFIAWWRRRRHDDR